ncbi:hypothetical protein BDQ17DRAFT_1437547 [Cyathus striatus]|nr:hypothetical protein BDQ17DRAFT_1437547 [Cyathus striatus]
MSDIEISPEDVKDKVAVQYEEEVGQVEEEAKAVRHAKEEAEAHWVAEEEATAQAKAEAEAKAARQAEAEAEAAYFIPEPDFPMVPPKILFPISQPWTSQLPFLLLLQKKKMNFLLNLSIIVAGRCKAVPWPTMTFAPASKCCKFFGGVDPVPLDKITPLPESPTPSVVASELVPSSISGYKLHDHSTISALASTYQSTCSTQVIARTPAKAASKSSKAPKASKSTGMKVAKCTHEEMPQLTSNEPINVKLLQNNLQELLKHFGSHVCINFITHGCECVFCEFRVKCSACSQVSTSHCFFSILSPNTEFTLSIAHCAGDSSLFGLNEVCHALNLSHMRAYRTLLAAELEQIEYVQNCITVVHRLQDIVFLHSPEHLHLIEGLNSNFTHDSLANLKEMADELTPWLPKPDALSALETTLECAFTLHTFNLHTTSTLDIAKFPNAKETVAIKDFAKSLKPCNFGKLGSVFGNCQLCPLSLEDYSGSTPGPSGSSSVRAMHGGNTEHKVDLGRED